jgi:hypothetical protein
MDQKKWDQALSYFEVAIRSGKWIYENGQLTVDEQSNRDN